VSSAAGVPREKILALESHERSSLFDETEKVALAYADAITLSDRDVSDELFAALSDHFTEEQIVELTAVIAWENASSKFNRALRVPSQHLWTGADRA
jgi:alkylhydroperoxidase family enzyme